MKTYHAIGLMSGTSLDGLDICHVRFEFPEIRFEILRAETAEYPHEWKSKLKNSIHLSAEELTKLDFDYGIFLGKAVCRFIRKNKIEKVDFIASHGHTVFHNPGKNYTLQIGKGQGIFAEIGIKTVFDFRTQDVLMGGQGAPLVPIGDRLLFGEFDSCLNLGGFSNISFEQNGKRIAFDICPFNIVLNFLAEKYGKNYDENGDLARNGKPVPGLSEKLSELAFYKMPPPKSLGIEFCNQFIFPLIEDFSPKTEDLLATFTQHFAVQISNVLNRNGLKNVLVSGGGAYNQFFIEQLRSKTSCEILLPQQSIIEYKEALIFALMGMLRIENETNILSSVTGARKNHCSGLLIS